MVVFKKTVWMIASLVFFFISSPVQLVQNLWCRFVLNRPAAVSFSMIPEVYAEVLATVDGALRVFMPSADSFEEEIRELSNEQAAMIEKKAGIKLNPVHGLKFYFYIGKAKGQVVGYAGADSVLGKWGLINYMLSISPRGDILDVMIIEYHEQRGAPVAGRRFLKQFFGKTIKDDIKLMKDIRGISGASISSRGMTDGLRKMIHVFNLFYGIS